MKEEVRCMDYILDSNELIYGTSTGQVKTKGIHQHLSYYDPYYADDQYAIDMEGDDKYQDD